ncbi:MAG: hypothetical protein JSV12_04735 [Candidatus Bathyarchaeota archaeon]|nr:MAG: hypothetical protein JSV12_04735 [Candidatus Bathyarchaeota archaeon]
MSRNLGWQEKFGVCLLEIVDEALTNFFGKNSAELIYIYLEENGLKREDIPSKIKAFSKGLTDILGKEATLVGNYIKKKLYSKFNIEPKKGSPSFVEVAIAIKSLDTGFLRSTYSASTVKFGI